MDSALTFQNVSFSYFSDNKILNNLSFKAHRGEILTIIGKSGCGKSTILNLISGLIEPQDGSVKFHSKYIKSHNHCAYLFQNAVLLPYKNAFENATIGLDITGNLNHTTSQQVDNLFKLFGIINTKALFPHQLSGGMKQRVGLIQTLSVESEIYLFDEPFTGIDRTTNLIIEDYIWEKIHSEATVCILVTHDLEQAIAMSDRILILSPNHEKGYLEVSLKDSKLANKPPSGRRESSDLPIHLFELMKQFRQT